MTSGVLLLIFSGLFESSRHLVASISTTINLTLTHLAILQVTHTLDNYLVIKTPQPSRRKGIGLVIILESITLTLTLVIY